MQFRLRTLLIALAVGPPVLAGAILVFPLWPILIAWLAVILAVLAIAMSLEQATRH